jgi:hypothetical protein
VSCRRRKDRKRRLRGRRLHLLAERYRPGKVPENDHAFIGPRRHPAVLRILHTEETGKSSEMLWFRFGRSQVVDVDRLIQPCRRELPVVRAEGYAIDSAQVGVPHLLPAVFCNIPDIDAPILISGSNHFSVMAKGNAKDFGTDDKRLARSFQPLHIPKDDAPIFSAGGEPRAIGAEGEPVHFALLDGRPLVMGQSGHYPTAIDIPQRDNPAFENGAVWLWDPANGSENELEGQGACLRTYSAPTTTAGISWDKTSLDPTVARIQ